MNDINVDDVMEGEGKNGTGLSGPSASTKQRGSLEAIKKARLEKPKLAQMRSVNEEEPMEVCGTSTQDPQAPKDVADPQVQAPLKAPRRSCLKATRKERCWKNRNIAFTLVDHIHNFQPQEGEHGREKEEDCQAASDSEEEEEDEEMADEDCVDEQEKIVTDDESERDGNNQPSPVKENDKDESSKNKSAEKAVKSGGYHTRPWNEGDEEEEEIEEGGEGQRGEEGEEEAEEEPEQSTSATPTVRRRGRKPTNSSKKPKSDPEEKKRRKLQYEEEQSKYRGVIAEILDYDFDYEDGYRAWFLCKWKNETELTWEPLESLKNNHKELWDFYEELAIRTNISHPAITEEFLKKVEVNKTDENGFKPWFYTINCHGYTLPKFQDGDFIYYVEDAANNKIIADTYQALECAKGAILNMFMRMALRWQLVFKAQHRKWLGGCTAFRKRADNPYNKASEIQEDPARDHHKLWWTELFKERGGTNFNAVHSLVPHACPTGCAVCRHPVARKGRRAGGRRRKY